MPCLAQFPAPRLSVGALKEVFPRHWALLSHHHVTNSAFSACEWLAATALRQGQALLSGPRLLSLSAIIHHQLMWRCASVTHCGVTSRPSASPPLCPFWALFPFSFSSSFRLPSFLFPTRLLCRCFDHLPSRLAFLTLQGPLRLRAP